MFRDFANVLRLVCVPAGGRDPLGGRAANRQEALLRTSLGLLIERPRRGSQAERIRRDSEKWGKVIRDANIKME